MPASTLAEEFRGLSGGKIRGLRGGMPVVGGCAAEFAEAGARLAQCGQIAGPGGCIFPGLLAELAMLAGKPVKLRIDNRIGAEGGQNSRFPARLADCLVIGEGVEGRVGGGQHFKIEALIQSARAGTQA